MIVNLLIVVTISIVISLLGIRPYLSASGIDYTQLLAFCLVWGMGGAFISLALSRIMAKWMMGVQVIAPNVQDPFLRSYVNRVHMLARAAGIETMPEVGIYESPDLNAFATGPTKNRSLVAVSSGLLRTMTTDEIDGVLGHEISHIANGDMVTMTLIQGVVNAFVMFLARVIAFAISAAMSRSSDERSSIGGGYWMTYGITIVLEIVFSLFGMIVIAFFSRWREFRADAGSARLAGREKMIRALKALKQTMDVRTNEPQSIAAFKISGRPRFLGLFATHPPLDVRIERLTRGNF